MVDVEQQNANLKSDKKKYEEYLVHYENRKKRVLDAIGREEHAISEESKQ